MVTRQTIQTTCDDIVREFALLQVIRFGSYAYGTPTEESDVDLLVGMDIPQSETRHHAVEIEQRLTQCSIPRADVSMPHNVRRHLQH